MSALPVTCGPVQAGPGFPSPRPCPQRAAPRFGSCPAPRGSHHSQYLLGQGWAETWGETPWEKRAQRKAHLILLLKQLEASDTCAGLPPRLAAGQHGGVGSAEREDVPDPRGRAAGQLQCRSLLASGTSSDLSAISPQERCHSPSTSSFLGAASSRPGGRGTGTGLQAPEPTSCLHALQKQQERMSAGSIYKPAKHNPLPSPRELPRHQHTSLPVPKSGFCLRASTLLPKSTPACRS